MNTTISAPRSTFGHALHAEWIKFWSLRSTWWTLISIVTIGLLVTVMTMSTAVVEYATATAEERASWDPTKISLTAHLFGQLIIGILGTLTLTSEYTTRLVQTSLMAVPRRGRLLAAKAIVVMVTAVVVGHVLMFASFLLGQTILRTQDVPYAALTDPGVLSAICGGGLYLTAIALLAVGIGAIIRSTAGALGTLVGIVLLIPTIAGIGLFPSWPWLQRVLDFWPTLGGTAILATMPDPDHAHPWLNLGGMCLGVAGILVAAFIVFRRRDV